MRTLSWMLAVAAASAIAAAAPAAPAELHVGSKRFTESYILGEIIKQTAQAAGEATSTHSQGLGNTAIVLNALTTAAIDVYPEYTGTGLLAILHEQPSRLVSLRQELRDLGVPLRDAAGSLPHNDD